MPPMPTVPYPTAAALARLQGFGDEVSAGDLADALDITPTTVRRLTSDPPAELEVPAPNRRGRAFVWTKPAATVWIEQYARWARWPDAFPEIDARLFTAEEAASLLNVPREQMVAARSRLGWAPHIPGRQGVSVGLWTRDQLSHLLAGPLRQRGGVDRDEVDRRRVHPVYAEAEALTLIDLAAITGLSLADFHAHARAIGLGFPTAKTRTGAPAWPWSDVLGPLANLVPIPAPVRLPAPALTRRAATIFDGLFANPQEVAQAVADRVEAGPNVFLSAGRRIFWDEEEVARILRLAPAALFQLVESDKIYEPSRIARWIVQDDEGPNEKPLWTSEALVRMAAARFGDGSEMILRGTPAIDAEQLRALTGLGLGEIKQAIVETNFFPDVMAQLPPPAGIWDAERVVDAIAAAEPAPPQLAYDPPLTVLQRRVTPPLPIVEAFAAIQRQAERIAGTWIPAQGAIREAQLRALMYEFRALVDRVVRDVGASPALDRVARDAFESLSRAVRERMPRVYVEGLELDDVQDWDAKAIEALDEVVKALRQAGLSADEVRDRQRHAILGAIREAIYDREPERIARFAGRFLDITPEDDPAVLALLDTLAPVSELLTVPGLASIRRRLRRLGLDIPEIEAPRRRDQPERREARDPTEGVDAACLEAFAGKRVAFLGGGDRGIPPEKLDEYRAVFGFEPVVYSGDRAQDLVRSLTAGGIDYVIILRRWLGHPAERGVRTAAARYNIPVLYLPPWASYGNLALVCQAMMEQGWAGERARPNPPSTW